MQRCLGGGASLGNGAQAGSLAVRAVRRTEPVYRVEGQPRWLRGVVHQPGRRHVGCRRLATTLRPTLYSYIRPGFETEGIKEDVDIVESVCNLK